MYLYLRPSHSNCRTFSKVSAPSYLLLKITIYGHFRNLIIFLYFLKITMYGNFRNLYLAARNFPSVALEGVDAAAVFVKKKNGGGGKGIASVYTKSVLAPLGGLGRCGCSVCVCVCVCVRARMS
jgi:hypothetical protein